jgi:hypothetical protein
MKLLELYTSILNYSGVSVIEDGSTQINFLGKVRENEAEGKRILMPYPKVLKQSDPATTMIFHPFREYVNRGESPIVRKLRKLISIRLNVAVIALIDRFINLLNSPALHKEFSPQQRELIKSITSIDLDPAKFLSASWKLFEEKPDSFAINLYLKKNGSLRGKKYNRVGVVSFTFYDSIKSTTLSEKQKKALYQLFNFIFPGSLDDPESYNEGTESAQCPWLDALLRSSYNVVSRIQELASLYKPYIKDPETDEIPEELVFDVKWVDEMDRLNQYASEIAMIPSQVGNEGVAERALAVPTSENKAADAAFRAINQPAAPTMPAPLPPSTSMMPQTVTTPLPYHVPTQPQQTPPPVAASPKLADGRLDPTVLLQGQMQPGGVSPSMGLMSIGARMAPQQQFSQQEMQIIYTVMRMAHENPTLYQATLSQLPIHLQNAIANNAVPTMATAQHPYATMMGMGGQQQMGQQMGQQGGYGMSNGPIRV